MTKIFQIKQILFERGKTQNWLAEEADINRAYLSQAINGRLVLTDAEKTRIANVLNLPVQDIFSDANGNT